jgi:hypothetical protein
LLANKSFDFENPFKPSDGTNPPQYPTPHEVLGVVRKLIVGYEDEAREKHNGVNLFEFDNKYAQNIRQIIQSNSKSNEMKRDEVKQQLENMQTESPQEYDRMSKLFRLCYEINKINPEQGSKLAVSFSAPLQAAGLIDLNDTSHTELPLNSEERIKAVNKMYQERTNIFSIMMECFNPSPELNKQATVEQQASNGKVVVSSSLIDRFSKVGETYHNSSNNGIQPANTQQNVSSSPGTTFTPQKTKNQSMPRMLHNFLNRIRTLGTIIPSIRNKPEPPHPELDNKKNCKPKS